MTHAADAYARASRTVMTPREAEAAVLVKAASRLQAIQADWANLSASLNEALTYNQKVWTIIAGCATAQDSPLPDALRQGIAQLSVFVFRRTIDTMIEPCTEKLSALININHQLAAGLRS